MPRSVEEIHAEQRGGATLRNLSSVLDEKLNLASRLGLYEFEAGEEGLTACSEAFRRLGRSERRQIGELLNLLCSVPRPDAGERQTHPLRTQNRVRTDPERPGRTAGGDRTEGDTSARVA
jgi:hypothetical protein